MLSLLRVLRRKLAEYLGGVSALNPAGQDIRVASVWSKRAEALVRPRGPWLGLGALRRLRADENSI